MQCMECRRTWNSDNCIPRYFKSIFRIIDCGHNLCSSCIKALGTVNYGTRNAYVCHKCRHRTRFSSNSRLMDVLPVNHDLLELIKAKIKNNSLDKSHRIDANQLYYWKCQNRDEGLIPNNNDIKENIPERRLSIPAKIFHSQSHTIVVLILILDIITNSSNSNIVY